jgi:methylphosphotriester-DNA--protein-cysteine methyltransferase
MKVLNALKLFYIRNLIKNENKVKFLFDHHFFTNQYYLHKSASEVHMANILNIMPFQLNQITQKSYNLDFEDLCEKYRFAHFWNEFTNPLNADLPINSLIDASGFKSNEDFSSLMSSHKEESKNIITEQYL